MILFSCSKRPKDINGDEPIEASDFIMAYPVKNLPITFNEKEFKKKESDSFFIKKNTLLNFIPDSLFRDAFKTTDNLKFYRKGQYTADSKEVYLFLVAERKEKKVAYVVCFDKNLVYSTGMELIENKTLPGVDFEAGLDKKLTIYKQKNKQSKDGKLTYNKSAYVYNPEGLFTLILTESNEPIETASIYNPIDSLPSTGPLSGNYSIDKKNFISIRDDQKPNKLLFFISISNNNINCEGSLRGDMKKVKPNVFHYNKADDHCMIEFTFTKNSIEVKELEACGNHRGIRCSFDGKFKKSR